ncbi:unnamed protein product [Nesidiocoris tenuis]|uniref:Uncharacterized protein n=1 Tax=Nesidiocoris tenuis TaxID=355587 RepID=A0A6H5HSY4_9HEMI|nr:unnamed protein product [Nesidiocoris tenuis]
MKQKLKLIIEIEVKLTMKPKLQLIIEIEVNLKMKQKLKLIIEIEVKLTMKQKLKLIGCECYLRCSLGEVSSPKNDSRFACFRQISSELMHIPELLSAE